MWNVQRSREAEQTLCKIVFVTEIYRRIDVFSEWKVFAKLIIQSLNVCTDRELFTENSTNLNMHIVEKSIIVVSVFSLLFHSFLAYLVYARNIAYISMTLLNTSVTHTNAKMREYDDDIWSLNKWIHNNSNFVRPSINDE